MSSSSSHQLFQTQFSFSILAYQRKLCIALLLQPHTIAPSSHTLTESSFSVTRRSYSPEASCHSHCFAHEFVILSLIFWPPNNQPFSEDLKLN